MKSEIGSLAVRAALALLVPVIVTTSVAASSPALAQAPAAPAQGQAKYTKKEIEVLDLLHKISEENAELDRQRAQSGMEGGQEHPPAAPPDEGQPGAPG